MEDQTKILVNSIHPIRLLQIAKSSTYINYFNCDNQTFERITRYFPVFNQIMPYFKALIENIRELKLDNKEFALFTAFIAFTTSRNKFFWSFYSKVSCFIIKIKQKKVAKVFQVLQSVSTAIWIFAKLSPNTWSCDETNPSQMNNWLTWRFALRSSIYSYKRACTKSVQKHMRKATSLKSSIRQLYFLNF